MRECLCGVNVAWRANPSMPPSPPRALRFASLMCAIWRREQLMDVVGQLCGQSRLVLWRHVHSFVQAHALVSGESGVQGMVECLQSLTIKGIRDSDVDATPTQASSPPSNVLVQTLLMMRCMCGPNTTAPYERFLCGLFAGKNLNHIGG